MPLMYVNYFGLLTKIVNNHGYALCVHGSVNRDFDLIAVPFEETVSPHDEVIMAIKKAIGNNGDSDELYSKVGHEPQGRICYTIECGGDGYFDISFTPSIQEAIFRVRQEHRRDAEVEAIIKKTNTL